MNKKSVFQRISKKSSKNQLTSDHAIMRHAFYKIRHYSSVKISDKEKELMKSWIMERGLVEKRDSLNNADYWLIGSLFGLKDERSY